MPKYIKLHKGKEKSLLRGHPWIFDGAVAEVAGEPSSGETVDVIAANGQWLARAAYSPASTIRARVWTFYRDEAIDQAFFDRRVRQALAYREKLAIPTLSNTYRIIHGESDGLPGCVVDKYGPFLVCQFLCAGTEANRQMILHSLFLIPGVVGE